MPLSKMALKWGFDDAGLGDVPGLDYDKMVNAIITKLAANDITQFFGKIQEAMYGWERVNGPQRFPVDYAVIRIHPYALNAYARNWPAEYLSPYAMARPATFGAKPDSVYGIPIIPDQRMFRTSWELQLGANGGRRSLLESGEVLEIVE